MAVAGRLRALPRGVRPHLRRARAHGGGRAAGGPGRAESWRLTTAGGTVVDARRVVVATGTHATPVVPDWPGRRTVPLVHSSGYREPSPYAGLDVLVVGAGSSGSEIAADLGRSAAGSTTLSVRTPPGLLPRAVGPWPTQLSAFALQHVPDRVGDLAVAGLGLRHLADARRGLPVPTRLLSDARRGTVPVLDAGLRSAVRAGRVRVVPAVVGLDGDEALLADGSRLRTDAVVAATGWRTGLEPLVGHLDVLDGRGLPRVAGGAAATPGLHFVGYGFPLTGYVHAAGHDAAALVDEVTGAGLVGRTVSRVRRLLPLPA